MIAYVFLDQHGFVKSTGFGVKEPEGAIIVGSTREALLEHRSKRLVAGSWQDLDKLPEPELTGGAVVGSDLPDGVVLHVYDQETGTTTNHLSQGGLINVSMPTDGHFNVYFDGPAPLVRSDIVDVTLGAAVQTLQAEDLAALRSSFRRLIEDLISDVRLRFITDIPGQEAVYLSKADEAHAYLATTPEPSNLNEFPLLQAEVGITAGTATDLAQLWLANQAAWRQIAAILEGIRMAGYAAVDAATSAAEMEASVDALRQSLQQLPT